MSERAHMYVCVCVWRDGREVGFQALSLMGWSPRSESGPAAVTQAPGLGSPTSLMCRAKGSGPFTPLEF